jgi:hypothetical protein
LNVALHVAGVLVAIAAIAGPGRALVGDPEAAWRRTSFVRVEIIVVAALFAVVLLVPLTAAQVLDVLRAWGDGSLTRALVALAGGLLLGAVCRASAYRMLAPRAPASAFVRPSSGPAQARYWGAIAGGFALMLAASALLRGWLGVAAVGVVAALGGVTAWACPVPGATSNDGPADPAPKRAAAVLGLVPPVIVFAALTEAAVDSLLLPGPPGAAGWKLLAATVAAGVLLAVQTAFAHFPDIADKVSDERPWLAGIAGLALVVATTQLAGVFAIGLVALCLVLALRIVGSNGAPELWAGGGVALGAAIAVYIDPVGNARVLGSVGVVLIASAGALVLLHAAAALATRRRPRWPVWWLPERVPVVTLLALWIAVAAAFPAATVHQARTADSAVPRRTLADAVEGWLDARAAEGRTAIPMLIAGASGGGSKAAYWTDLVLDCLAGDGAPAGASGGCDNSPAAAARRNALFLTSSVSGGSVGVYHYMLHRGEVGRGAAWIDETAGREVLSPVTAWGMFHDAPAFLLGMQSDPRRCDSALSCRVNADRALVQEAAVAGFPGGGIVPPPDGRVLQAGTDGAPVTIFNGTVSGGDGRVLMSPLQLAPPRPPDPGCPTRATGEPSAGSVDAYDVVGRNRDVPLVTAALLSARFPVIAPPGRLGDGPAVGCDDGVPLPPIRVRDGGYLENTGLLTITDLLPTIDAAIDRWRGDREHPERRAIHVQVMVLSVDDDPMVLDGAPTLTEARAGTLSIAQQAGPEYLSRMSRERLTTCQYPNVSYLRISPQPHAGASAATGWEVSTTARRRDLANALAPDRPAGKILRFVRGVLDGTVEPRDCDRNGPSRRGG